MSTAAAALQAYHMKRRPASPPAESDPPSSLSNRLKSLIIGQDESIDAIVPYVDMYKSGLSPEGRPAGIFLLLGPTGTGKTATVEALAAILHGSKSQHIRIDCGEYQSEHEVAKLIGAPPGYLGHRETQPALTQQKLTAAASENCSLTIVLFDEIEKGAASIHRLLLGIFDRGIMKLGDNTSVQFEKTIIFLTSNLGARERPRAEAPYGIAPAAEVRHSRAGIITREAAKRKFSPEFMNRIDTVLSYSHLGREQIQQVIELQIEAMQRHILSRLGNSAFVVSFTKQAKELIAVKGTSAEYGAREVKRVIQREIMHRIARLSAHNGLGTIHSKVTIGVSGDQFSFNLS